MGNFRFVVLSNPPQGRDDEYSDWYNGHMQEVVSVPGFNSVQRYRIHNLAKPAPQKYLAVYVMSSETLEQAAEHLDGLKNAVSKSPRSDSANPGDSVAGLFEVCAEVRDPNSAGAGSWGLLALTSPVEGREPEFDSWYVGEHMRDVIAVPGFADAERMKLRRALRGEPKQQFLAVYGMEADSQAAAGAIMQEVGKAKLTLSDTLAPTSASFLLEACSPRVTAARAEPK